MIRERVRVRGRISVMIDVESEPKLSGIRFRVWSPGCEKWIYLDENHAMDSADNHKDQWKDRKNKKAAVPEYVYQCRHCGGYHLTRQYPGKPPNRAQKRRKKAYARERYKQRKREAA